MTDKAVALQQPEAHQELTALASDREDNFTDIAAGKLWSFAGGVHPPERKTLANQTPIARMPLPKRLYLPLKQHIGAAGDLLVQTGDLVKKGQPLTAPGINGGLPIHAPTSGRIAAIAPHQIPHPSGLAEPSIELIPDGADEWTELTPLRNYQERTSAELIDFLSAAGIAGLGGAAFPTGQKLATSNLIDFLIINGVECEPYIVADDRLMREHAAGIVRGINILRHITGVRQVLIGIEDNKPEAAAAMQDACAGDDDLQVRVIPTVYPSGGERQLIEVLTGRQVPTQGLPRDVGVLMQNVGTAYAIYRAVVLGEPLIERVITLTGEALARPGTVWALLGTPVDELLSFAGYQPSAKPRIIMGGPMMGFTLPALDIPVSKGSNCILAPTKTELPVGKGEMPCIRCGDCAQVCPASLLPQQLFWFAQANDYDGLREHNLADCIECGACAYVCPSEIPLVHYYRRAKAEMREQYIEKQKAEIARQRFEARKLRLEREQQERQERHQRAAEARKKAQAERAANTDGNDPVKAALERVKAKRAAQSESASASDTSTTSPEPTAASSAQPSQQEPSQQDRIAAAVARAKAKKAAQQAEQQASTSASKQTDAGDQPKDSSE